MILGLFMDRIGIKIVPMSWMILSGLVLVAGFAFMIFRYVYEKGESDIDPAVFKKISGIAAIVFLIYGITETIAAFACIAVNEACRNGYHFDIQNCVFCSGFKNSHSAASDCLTLGLYFDAFVVNAYITNLIKNVREKLSKKPA